MNCNVTPYDGEENYIFISFDYQDGARVFPALEMLGRMGYRVWYDDRTRKGDYWAEVIADKLVHACMCLFFVSHKAIRAHSCRKQINYALLGGIPVALVFLEAIQTTLAMRMQLSILQEISLEEFNDDSSALGAVCTEMPRCRGKEMPEIEIQDWSSWNPDPGNSEHENRFALDEWLVHERMQEAMRMDTAKTSISNDQGESHRQTAILPPKQFLITRDSTGEERRILTEIFLIGASEDV
ncbi:MAG: toll/interleukin-1 receptor domain-containing protein, partial [Lachnospiraceae bacterium]|nr:toll/interleukin-1 receptor domain-containing protein [Lachnospiraceae bacterium]